MKHPWLATAYFAFVFGLVVTGLLLRSGRFRSWPRSRRARRVYERMVLATDRIERLGVEPGSIVDEMITHLPSTRSD